MRSFMFAAVALYNRTASGGGGDPPGAPADLHATNDGSDYTIAWTNAVDDQETQVFRDGSSYDTVAADVDSLLIGTMVGDGTHTWKARHRNPDTAFSDEITTVDGVVGGSPPAAAPSDLSTYSYAAGTKFGIQWSNGDAAAQTELHRDSVLYATLSPGVGQKDIGFKSGDGSHSWKCRHLKNGQYSAFSSSITTLNGVLV